LRAHYNLAVPTPLFLLSGRSSLKRWTATSASLYRLHWKRATSTTCYLCYVGWVSGRQFGWWAGQGVCTSGYYYTRHVLPPADIESLREKVFSSDLTPIGSRIFQSAVASAASEMSISAGASVNVSGIRYSLLRNRNRRSNKRSVKRLGIMTMTWLSGDGEKRLEMLSSQDTLKMLLRPSG